MKRSEAIEEARQLSVWNAPLAVVYDEQLDDFFISQGDVFVLEQDNKTSGPYKVVKVFK